MKATEDNQNRGEIISKLKAQQKARKEEQKRWKHFGSEELPPSEAEELLKEVQKRLGKRKKVKSVPSFASLFVNETNAAKVIELFIRDKYVSEGKWISGGKSKKIGTAFWVLDDNGLLWPGCAMTRMRTFCSGLGMKKTDGKLRSIVNRPKWDREEKEDYIEFASLFKNLK